MCEILRGVSLSDFDLSVADQGPMEKVRVARAISLILIVMAHPFSWLASKSTRIS
jgi:hypothetical protein